MAPASHIPPDVDEAAARLLERAFTLDGQAASHRLYRDWAETYDGTMLDGLGYLTPSRVAAMLARHQADRAGAVLDIGCGTGLAAAELAGHGFATVDGLDISPEMMRVAERRGLYRRLIEADLLGLLPIADAAYDGAICTGTFTHGHVGAGCLDEIVRVLRPGARFAFNVALGVWDKLGFAARLAALDKDGRLVEVERNPGRFYATAAADDGWYCVYERR